MNTTAWLSSLTALLLVLGMGLGLVVKWLNDNKGNITALIEAVQDIHRTVKQHGTLVSGAAPPALLPPAIAVPPTPPQAPKP